MTKEIIKYVKKANKFFIIDSKNGYAEQGNEKDVDFEKYVWNTTRYNKIEKNDLFIYRRPQRASKNHKFYLFGCGQFGEIQHGITTGTVYSLLLNSFKFKKEIYQDKLEKFDWNSKTRKANSWGGFFNQYGITEIDKNDFVNLVNLVSDNEIESDTENNKDVEETENLKTTFIEGNKKVVYSTQYERNPKLRRQALKLHGYKCLVCGFDFKKVYGEIGSNFIEVHHVKPISKYSAEHTVNPETDLVPVCANCHRMIHRRKNDILSISELKNLIKQQE